MEKLIVITAYPPKNSKHGSRFSAVASYAKNTIDSIKLYSKKKGDYIILADVLGEDTDYKEDGVTVRRVWERNTSSLFLDLLRSVLRYSSHKKILFEFEFGMFGGKKYLILMLPIFILLLRILQRQVYLVNHGVILDAGEVGAQLGLVSRGLKEKIYSVGLKVLYWSVMTFSNKVIVFEQYLKVRIVNVLGIDENKIVVIPHGVESHRQITDKVEARQKLGLNSDEFIVTCFGFLIWYKGSDWLIEAFSELYNGKKIPQNSRLIMAGGFSSTHQNDPVYRKYISKVQGLLRANKELVTFTDFLPEDKIDLYFSASDLVILPHRVMISASGPFSFAISHKKPFLLSMPLIGYMDNPDFKKVISEYKIDPDKVFFDQTDSTDLESLINYYSKNEEGLEQLQKVSTEILKSRSWEVIGKNYHEIIFG